MRAAEDLIDEGGYGAASVVAVARRAGVATGTLYYHFGSKEELFVEVFRVAADRELAAMHAAAAQPNGWASSFEAVIAAFAGRALSRPRLAWALVHEPVDALVDAERLACRRRYCEGMAALLGQGVEGGELPAQDVSLSAAALVGAISEALVGPLSPVEHRPGSDPAPVVAGIVALCLGAVGVKARRKR